jgi:glycosyltransferase involved in cell wall biosynthesis
LKKVTKKYRVAYLTESYTMGGVERMVTTLISNLDIQLYDPLLICTDDPEIKPFVDHVAGLGVPVICTDLISLKRNNSIRLVLDLASLLKKQKIDVLHTQILGASGARSVALAAKVARIPVVIHTLHGAPAPGMVRDDTLLTRICRKCVSVFTTPSLDSCRLQVDTIGVAADQVKLVYNGIEVSGFNPSTDKVEARRQLGLPLTGQIVGTIGRLAQQKGIEYFIGMAEIVSQSAPDCHFVIVGDGGNRNEYEAQARASGISDKIIFAGFQSNVSDWLAAMDVFVLASIFEPFGLVIAEAMAMELPVVATNVGGIGEVMQAGETGISVPSKDPRALADAVSSYLSDPKLAAAHGMAGRQRVLKMFAAATMAREYEKVYRNYLPIAASITETQASVAVPKSDLEAPELVEAD